jgi:cytochrome c-type biogenesis protein CcmH/NrfG
MTRSPRSRLRAQAGRLDPHARIGLTPEASAEDVERAHGELVSFLEGAPEGVRRWAREEIAAADHAYAALSDPAGARAPRRPSSLRRIAVGTLTLAVTAGIVLGVYHIGGGPSKAKSGQAGATEPPGLSRSEEASVSQLMVKLKANPKDVATLIALGDVYFKARDYNNSGGWMKRAVAIDPGNATARLALGAAEFNLGDAADARRDWLRVIAADPKNVEAYYDLGFLYVSKQPPDMADAKKMWAKVVALAPNSSAAKTIATHLKGLAKEASAKK